MTMSLTSRIFQNTFWHLYPWVIRMLSFSGGSVSVILALPIHICWIDKINQNVLTVTVH